MIEGSYRFWDLNTTGQLVDGLQQKRKPIFIERKWNHVVFSRATILSFHPVYWSTHPQKEQNVTQKSTDSVDWLQKGIWYGPKKLENSLKLCKGSDKLKKFIEKIMNN